MQMFYEKLDENIVQEHAKHYQQKVPEQLNFAPENRAWENDVPVQEISGRE